MHIHQMLISLLVGFPLGVNLGILVRYPDDIDVYKYVDDGHGACLVGRKHLIQECVQADSQGLPGPM